MDRIRKINKLRIEMKKTIRYGILIVLLIGMLVSGYMLYIAHQLPETEEIEYTVFEYKHAASIDYEVHLLENPFFDDEIAESGLAYIVNLTDFISVYFAHSYIASRGVNLSANYSINSYLTAYKTHRDPDTREEIRTKIWQTSEVLLPLDNDFRNQERFEREDIFKVDYAKYLEFMKLVEEELEFSPSLVELRIDYNIKVVGEAYEEKIESELTPTFRIAITDGLFDVEGNLSIEVEDSIMGSTTRPNEEALKNRETYRTLTIVLFVLFLLFFIITRTMKLTKLQTALHSIMKKHGDRIVLIKEESTLTSEKTTLQLVDFLDLVKVADETAQPIFYEVISEEEHLFYVLESNLIYAFRVFEEEQESEKSEVKIEEVETEEVETKDEKTARE